MLSASEDPDDESARQILIDAVDAFECVRSSYHERFLKEKAFESCSRNTSRTYLLIDQNAFDDYCVTGQDASRIIAAYFTVGISSLSLSTERISKKKQKDLRKHLYPRDNTIGCFVIGELCRAGNRSKEELSGEYLLNECLTVIRQAQGYIGGRIVLVDSRRKVLDSLYGPFGFKELMLTGSNTNDGEELITSFAIL